MRFRLTSTLAAVIALAFPCGALAMASPTTFSYTGGEQSYTVPSGVVMAFLAVKGGRGGQYAEGGGHEGGVGALLPVTPGQQLFVEVGAAGVYNGGPVFGGGGAGGAPPPVLCMLSNNGGPCAQAYASSGGGASDVRTCSMSASTCPGGVSSAATRLLVGGGGGGTNGSGNGQGYPCGPLGGGGRASSFQYPPGNPSTGPVPIITAAGIVYPGWDSANGGQVGPGVTSAGGGSAVAGGGGILAPCSTSSTSSLGGSIAGSSGVGSAGGTGGNASSLAPNYSVCTVSANTCQDPGAGGGGGGGYFGGGGGATGYMLTGSCSPNCNSATAGQGGGGGSSFVSSQMMDAVDESALLGAPAAGTAAIVPAIEIDAPVNGAVYTPGQAIDAAWACGYDTQIGQGVSSCTGTVATGAAIDTSPGTHTFTVSGTAQSNGSHTVSASVTYTVKSGGGSGGGATAHGSLAGLKFTLTSSSACTAPGGKLAVTLSKRGSGKGYRLRSLSYYVGHGKPALVSSHEGTVHVPLGKLKAGSHTLKLVIKLVSTKHHHGKPKTKTLTLTVPFSIC